MWGEDSVWQCGVCTVSIVIKFLSSKGKTSKGDSQTGLNPKHSSQMFLLGNSFKEIQCRRNVKTSLIRPWRKGL